jgi:uncharacterized protein
MVNTPPPNADVDLRRLDEYLLSAQAPDDCMGLSDLDGFLTGIAVGPEFILPCEWLPIIWGIDEPDFASIDEAVNILATIVSRYVEIVAHLDTDPDLFDPVFLEGPGGEIIADDWAAGFLNAVKLRTMAWEPLVADQQAQALIIPLLILGTEAEDRPPLTPPPRSEQDIRGHAENDPDVIRKCVFGIRAFWSEHRAERSGRIRRGRRRAEPRQRRRFG